MLDLGRVTRRVDRVTDTRVIPLCRTERQRTDCNSFSRTVPRNLLLQAPHDPCLVYVTSDKRSGLYTRRDNGTPSIDRSLEIEDRARFRSGR